MAEKKYLGRDCELSTTGIDPAGNTIDAWIVTRGVLDEIAPALARLGVSVWPDAGRYSARRNPGAAGSAYSSDCLRHWTSGGQCIYADMAHVEVCTVPTASPRTFAAQCLSTLLTAEAARSLAEQTAEAGTRYDLAASNADLADPGISFGSHLSVAVSSALWDDLFVEQRHPARLGFVASVMAAAIPFFGAGYLFPQPGGRTRFSLSARAHHLTRIHTLTTTQPWQRGLLNRRREPHAIGQDRLHLIGFDFCLISAALLASLLQCALAAAEEGYCGLILYDPVRAMRRWSWNLDLTTGLMPAAAPLADGRQLTLPQYLRELAKTLLQMCESRLIQDDTAPDAQELLPRIIDLTRYAEEGSLNHCGRHLDWAAKLLWLLARGDRFDGAAARVADHDFTNTNPSHGVFWKLWDRGAVDPLIERSDVDDCIRRAPTGSRAAARGQLIECFAADISAIDWSYVELNRSGDIGGPRVRIDFPQVEIPVLSNFAAVIDTARDANEFRANVQTAPAINRNGTN